VLPQGTAILSNRPPKRLGNKVSNRKPLNRLRVLQKFSLVFSTASNVSLASSIALGLW
jgi:hypothetical protein